MAAESPDYAYWVKFDYWSRKDASLLICGFDPDNHRGVTLTARETPSELAKPKLLNRLFVSTDFAYKYKMGGITPLMYINECRRKNWVVPEELLECAREFLKHTSNYEKAHEELAETQKTRERDNLMKLIAALVMVYFSKDEKQSANPASKVNVSVITEHVLQYLENAGVTMVGLGKSNIHKKISEGLRLFRNDIE